MLAPFPVASHPYKQKFYDLKEKFHKVKYAGHFAWPNLTAFQFLYQSDYVKKLLVKFF